MTNLSELSDLIDLEITNSDLQKSRKLIRGFSKLNRNIRIVAEEASIVDGKTIIRIAIPRSTKNSWIQAIEAQFENENITMEVVG